MPSNANDLWPWKWQFPIPLWFMRRDLNPATGVYHAEYVTFLGLSTYVRISSD